MSWNPRDDRSGLEYGGTAHDYYWNVAYNPDARYSTCLADCTCLAYGRCLEEGCRAPVTSTSTSPLPDAKNWHSRLASGWSYENYNDYVSSIKPGDLIEFSSGNHVIVVERVIGSSIYCSSSLYTGNNGFAYEDDHYSPRTADVMGSTMQDVSNWMIANYPIRFYYYGTVNQIKSRWSNIGEPDYILVNPDSGGSPTPPTPSDEHLSIDITPASYTATMSGNNDYIDFTYDIVITGIPMGETVSGGNSFPDLIRVANTGWSYTNYTVNGVTYRRGQKRQTLRYYRTSNSAYTVTKHMYFNITKTTGTINTDTPMYITVQRKLLDVPVRVYIAAKRRKRGRMNATFYIN